MLIGNHLLECLVSYLNLGVHRSELPYEFVGVFDSDEYNKFHEYNMVVSIFSIISSTLVTIAALLFSSLKTSIQ